MNRFFDKVAAAMRRSRMAALLATVFVWFLVSSILGLASGAADGYKYPAAVYVYNAFTIFSNLNDGLNLAVAEHDGGMAVHVLPMVISCLLIISGMVGIAALTAAITAKTLDVDEQRFDQLMDELRHLAVIGTCPESEESCPDGHRILRAILDRVSREIVPTRTNSSLQRLNIYEFEYLMVNVINKVIEERELLDEPLETLQAYDVAKLEGILNWADSLDTLHGHLANSTPSSIVLDLRRAWCNFSELVRRVRLAQEQCVESSIWKNLNPSEDYVSSTAY